MKSPEVLTFAAHGVLLVAETGADRVLIDLDKCSFNSDAT